VILHHLPVLEIVIPLLTAPVVVIFRRTRIAWGLAMLALWASFAIAGRLLFEVLANGPVSYDMGNWASPYGIVYRVDALSAFMAVFVSTIGAVVLTFAPRSVTDEIPEDRRYLFYALYLLSVTGALGISITGDLFNLFVFLEISALSSYSLVALGRDRRALTASFRYLVMGTAGATFILIGIGLLYMMTGSLNMLDVARLLPEATAPRTLFVAFAFLTVGVALKMALFPLHLWLPNAYTYAPSVVSAFLAATATKVAIYVFLRLTFTVFGPAFAFGTVHVQALLLPLSLLAIYTASTVAIFQTDMKRMLAYSSLAQIGYMVLGISFATVTGLTGGIVHLMNHALIKGGLFLATGCLVLRLGSSEMDALRGAGRRMPWTMMAWVVGGLGLIGVPATAGFVSKWYLVLGAVERHGWPVAVLVLLSSLLALAYVWRVVEIAYFQPVPEGAPPVREAPLSMLIPTWILIGTSLVLGVWTQLSAGVAHRAAVMLLGGWR